MRIRPVVLLLCMALLAPTAARAGDSAGDSGQPCSAGTQQPCRDEPRGKKTPSPSATPDGSFEEGVATCTGGSSQPTADPEPGKGPKKTPEPAPTPEPTSSSIDVSPGAVFVDPGYDPSTGLPSEVPEPSVEVGPSVSCSGPIAA